MGRRFTARVNLWGVLFANSSVRGLVKRKEKEMKKSFAERFGKLTVAQARELNRRARETCEMEATSEVGDFEEKHGWSPDSDYDTYMTEEMKKREEQMLKDYVKQLNDNYIELKGEE